MFFKVQCGRHRLVRGPYSRIHIFLNFQSDFFAPLISVAWALAIYLLTCETVISFDFKCRQLKIG